MPRRYRRRRPARRPRRNIRKPRAPSRSQMARITETFAAEDLNPNTSYANVFTLAQFERASAIAPYFKWYKAVKVTWSYEPLFNTFQAASTSGITVPYFYSIMNRTQDNYNYLLADIQAHGARPIKFTKKIVKSYRPNWCSPGLLTYGSAPFTRDNASTQPAVVGAYSNGLKAERGWLMSPNTNTGGSGVLQVPTVVPNQPIPGGSSPAVPEMAQIATNTVAYNGHDVYLDQAGVPSGTKVCRTVCTVEWVFKDPNNATAERAAALRQFICPKCPDTA